MLVILCIEQVREVRGFEQIHYFALLRSTARLSMMVDCMSLLSWHLGHTTLAKAEKLALDLLLCDKP